MEYRKGRRVMASKHGDASIMDIDWIYNVLALVKARTIRASVALRQLNVHARRCNR